MSFLIPVLFFFLLSLYIATRVTRRKTTYSVTEKPEICFKSGAWYLLTVIRLIQKFPNGNHLSMIREKHANGKVFSLSFPLSLVFVSHPDLCIDMLNSPYWADRPKGRAFELSEQGRGILLRNGPMWKELRGFSIKTMAELGLSKKTNLEDYVVIEMKELFGRIDNLVSETGNRIQVKNLFSFATMNVMWSVLTGRRFSEESAEYIMLRDSFAGKIELSGAKQILYELFGTIFKKAPKLFGYKKHFEYCNTLTKYFREFIEEREEKKKNGEHNYDLTDLFLDQIELHGNGGNEVLRSVYTKEELVVLLMDLISTGMDTSKTALEHTAMFMCKYPQVQKNIQEEIEAVVGKYRLPSYLEHASKMPYTVATLMEIRRIANILPFTVRSSTQEYNYKGISIKKGTIAVVNLHGVNMDEEFWGDPEIFRPERFLNSENNFIPEKVSRTMTFGSGPRRCPGQEMGTVYGFVILTGLLQKYNLRAADDLQILQCENKAMPVNTITPFLMSTSKNNDV